MQPDYNLSNTDLILDRNGLRKLFAWAKDDVSKDWRIDVDIVNNTMILSRWESDPTVLLNRVGSWGHSFKDKLVEPIGDLRNTFAHHRVVSYTLGGLKMVVRYEADAYFSNDVKPEMWISTAMNVPDESEGRPSGKLSYTRAGHLVPVDSIVMMKTSAGSKRLRPEAMAQVYFSQTSHICLGMHDRGRFASEDNVKMDVLDAEKIRRWEDENRVTLQKMVAVIKHLRKVCGRDGGGQYMLVCEKNGEDAKKLKLYRRGGKGVQMPDSAHEWFWKASS